MWARPPGGKGEPGPEGAPSGGRDREQPPTPPAGLALLGEEAQLGEARRLLVEESMRKRPEVTDRGGRVTLEVVGRRRALTRDQAKHEVRGGRQLSRGE